MYNIIIHYYKKQWGIEAKQMNSELTSEKIKQTQTIKTTVLARKNIA